MSSSHYSSEAYNSTRPKHQLKRFGDLFLSVFYVLFVSVKSIITANVKSILQEKSRSKSQRLDKCIFIENNFPIAFDDDYWLETIVEVIK